MVPTVDRGVLPAVFCSMAIVGAIPEMLSASGFFRSPKNLRA